MYAFYSIVKHEDRVLVTYKLSHRPLSLQWKWMVTATVIPSNITFESVEEITVIQA